MQDESETSLIQRAAGGESAALSRLLTINRSRLERMIVARIDKRLNARMDASDVIQEVHVDVFQRFAEYAENQNVPFITWLRFLTKQKLDEINRRNLLAQRRDVRRELRLSQDFSNQSSIILANYYTKQVSSPSSLISKKEIRQLVLETIASMNESDRSILVLRHVDQLTSDEAAAELGITANTCRQRHVRALKRLKQLLEKHRLDWELK